MRIFLCIILLVIMSGCSSVVTSTAAYVVAKYSEIKERKTRSYTAVNRCYIRNEPDAFKVAESVMTGVIVSYEYQKILAPEEKEIKPLLAPQLAYVLYVIADLGGDKRAAPKMKRLEAKIDSDITEYIKNKIKNKYLDSYIHKCYQVPARYKIRKSMRDLAKE